MNDQLYMHRAIYMASLAGLEVQSNPPVGAVVVENNQVIGEGYTQAFGGKHAEVMAIESVHIENRKRLKNATIYVTLEPCNHFGKTPPCSQLIIENKLKKVVISQIDPNPEVSGTGVQELRSAGIEVTTGMLQKESNYLLRPFKKWMKNGLPYVILKWAQSKDRYFGQKDKQVWLSNQYSKLFAHKLRSQCDAIMIGTNTVLTDDPSLTNRLWSGPSPTRIILDRQARIPIDHSIYKDPTPTIIYSEKEQPKELPSGPGKSFVWVTFPSMLNGLEMVLKDLGSRNFTRVMIEGGAQLHKSFIANKLWDEAYVIRTNQNLTSGISAPNCTGNLYQSFMLNQDEVLHILNDCEHNS